VVGIKIDDKSTGIGMPWGGVVNDRLKVNDPSVLYYKLRDELTLGINRDSYSNVLEAIDNASRNLDNAGLLYRVCKSEYEKFKIGFDERMGVMRIKAQSELYIEYKSKIRKSPSEKDIIDYITYNWPDEYKSLLSNEIDFRNTLRSFEALYIAWKTRAQSLRNITDLVIRMKGL
jgi:hypothetical protein